MVELLIAARVEARDSPLRGLTAREREVLGGIAEGKSNAAIASSLFLTKRAVEKNINSIFSKLGFPDNDRESSRRVLATIIFLAQSDGKVLA